jgi:hypothetical protein
MAAVGLVLLSVALASERIAKAAAQGDSVSAVQLSSGSDERLTTEPNVSACAACSTCVPSSQQSGETLDNTAIRAGLPWHLILNLAGGLCLATAHTRNFLLCRKNSCTHCD